MAVATSSHSTTKNLDGLEAIARSLSSAARELSHASGFARQGQKATQHTAETLRAMRAVAQEAELAANDPERRTGLQRKLRGLSETISQIQSASFAGLPVFSQDTLRVQIEHADLSVSAPVELNTSQEARELLRSFESDDAPELEQIEQALAATETLDQEFEAAARKIEGSRSVIAQERLANLNATRDSAQRVTAEELGERVASVLQENSTELAKSHKVPDSGTLLALLEEPA